MQNISGRTEENNGNIFCKADVCCANISAHNELYCDYVTEDIEQDETFPRSERFEEFFRNVR
jgi:hypothetical protein